MSINVYIERLIREDEDWGELSDSSLGDDCREDTRAAVMEVLEQAERGEARPAEEVFADFRQTWLTA